MKIIQLCGDFNTKPEDEELTFLKKQSGYKVSDGFIAGGGNSCVSTPAHGADVAEEEDGRRIGHIFVLEDRNRPVAKLKCSNSRIIFDQPDAEGLMPSDHFGVAFDFKLSRMKRDGQSQVYRYASFTQSRRRSREGR